MFALLQMSLPRLIKLISLHFLLRVYLDRQSDFSYPDRDFKISAQIPS
jgi:hypothetical protein